MSTKTVLPVDRNQITQLSSSRQEPEWVLQQRLEALELTDQLELPVLEKMHINRWNIDAFGTHTSTPAPMSLEQLPQQIKDLLSSEQQPENVLIQTNSGGVFSSLSEELTKQGVIFSDMNTAIKEHSDLIKPYFMNSVKKDENLLTALHASMWNGGAFLYVPKNVVIEEPIQALYYTDDAEAVFSPHILIIAEERSSVTYVDHYTSGTLTGSLVHNGIAEVYVKQGATVHFASTHNLDSSVTDLAYRRAVVEKDGKIYWVVGEMGYGNAMSETTSILKGDGSLSDAKIICVGIAEQQLSLTTKAVHIGKSSTSDMITRAVIRDRTTAIVNGITKIERGATGALGGQTERLLMLSPQARGDANPILLIDEDDVKAGHAASAGQVNKEQVHYLMSRGITREEAQRLIVYGFLAPVVSEIPISNLQQQLQKLVERKLGQ